MPTYVCLMNYTDQGIRNIKESPERVRRAEAMLKDTGAKLTALYLTMGTYDLVCVFEAPDDEAMARIALTLGSQGNVRTTTLKAFPREQFEKIVGAIG